ncbi:MAG: fatty acid desaturase family protein [Alphaproteobacteria bacterium]
MDADADFVKRDYSLLGADAERAVEMGLASAQWYHSDVSRKDMKALMQRRDGPAIRDTLLWVGALIVFAAAAVSLWPSVWSIPFFLAYGVLYGSAGDSRWHECGHGSAFKTRWMNDVVYHIASFMMVRNPVRWRWSHARHHTDTIIVGRDPEIAMMRPPVANRVFLNLLGIVDMWGGLRLMLLNAAGRIDREEATFIPQSEHSKVILVARVWCVIYGATIIASLLMWSILPLMLIGLPRLYGAWHHILTGVMQHAALAENVVDHRLNSRTMYLNPISRFIYWNMNYHIEHHMFPMVPYHALPRLHALIKDDLPTPNRSMIEGYREAWPVLKRQLRYEDIFLERKLPDTARPYRLELHGVIGEPVPPS